MTNLTSRSDEAFSLFKNPVELEGEVKGAGNYCHTEVVDDQVTLQKS